MAARKTGHTVEHTKRMIEGRAQGIIVRKYLMALAGEGELIIRRGDINQKIETINTRMESANAFERMKLLKQKRDLESATRTNPVMDIDSLEQDFIEIAKDYSMRMNIDRSLWLEMKVPEKVLDEAGIG